MITPHTAQFNMLGSTIRDRSLDDYDVEIFPSCQSEVVDLLGDVVPNASSMVELLRGLSPAAEDKPLHWVDMAGGLAVALREASILRTQNILGEITLTNVDLFDWREELAGDLKALSAEMGMDLGNKAHEPQFIQDNAETVVLEEPADLITSVQGIQYFDDPLRALVNWYNQLNGDGLMVVARASHWWPREISQRSQSDETEPFAALFSQFEEHGIRYATGDAASSFIPEEVTDFEVLAIQKQAETRLQLNAALMQVVAGFSWKVVQYDDAKPAIEVVRT